MKEEPMETLQLYPKYSKRAETRISDEGGCYGAVLDIAIRRANSVIKVLFVCHGNICRSPMAEFMMKKLVADEGLADAFVIDSAATSTEELGNDMYPPAKRLLTAKGVPFTRRAARQICRRDYDYYDYIVGLDEYNIRNIHRFFGGDPEGKILMLLSRPVADPWYTGDFESTYNDLQEGLPLLLTRIKEN